MFRFSIREIALLTLAVAIGMGWAVDRWHIGTSLQKMTEARYELLKAKQAEAKARMELARTLHSLSKPSKSADPPMLPFPRKERADSEVRPRRER
jgi:hypothetical protein